MGGFENGEKYSYVIKVCPLRGRGRPPPLPPVFKGFYPFYSQKRDLQGQFQDTKCNSTQNHCPLLYAKWVTLHFWSLIVMLTMRSRHLDQGPCQESELMGWDPFWKIENYLVLDPFSLKI